MRSKVVRISLISLLVLSVAAIAALLTMSVTGEEIWAQAREPIAGLQGLTDKPHVTAYNQHNLIRFHVIANSDSDRDQALKRRIRDRIVQRMSPEFSKAGSLTEAREIVKAHLQDIKQIATKEVSSWGEQYPITVQLGRFDFPIKTYGKITLPAGNYEAVRVVIGQGQGANWWCVLFPPLCFVDVSRAMNPVSQQVVNEAVYTTESPGSNGINIENTDVEPQNIKIKFKVLELFDW